MKYWILCFSLCLFALVGCEKEEPLTTFEQYEFDRGLIEDYLADNNIDAVYDSSRLIYYTIDEAGSGGYPSDTSTVEVKYKGYFLDGEVFDQTLGEVTISFPLQNVILGWQVGIPLFQKGGKGTLYLPSFMGYGVLGAGSGTIPPNTPIIFDVELIDFE